MSNMKKIKEFIRNYKKTWRDIKKVRNFVDKICRYMLLYLYSFKVRFIGRAFVKV